MSAQSAGGPDPATFGHQQAEPIAGVKFRLIAHSRITFLLILWLFMPTFSVPIYAIESAAFFVENYGLADQNLLFIARDQDVYERVKAAAALPGRRSPELYVVESAADPWAQALPDGSIVLSRRAIAI